jgi:hypothetical protein
MRIFFLFISIIFSLFFLNILSASKENQGTKTNAVSGILIRPKLSPITMTCAPVSVNPEGIYFVEKTGRYNFHLRLTSSAKSRCLGASLYINNKLLTFIRSENYKKDLSTSKSIMLKEGKYHIMAIGGWECRSMPLDFVQPIKFHVKVLNPGSAIPKDLMLCSKKI